jgi:ABC-type transport system involved in multi-copper enzyme maturation permease subunit
MIWTIVKKEFYFHLLTFRLWTATVLCFVLIPFVLQVSIKRYEEKLSNYRLEIQKFDGEVHTAPTYSFVRTTIIRPPEVTSILCSGIEDNVGNKIPILLGQTPFLPTGKLYGRDNPFLASFTSVDMLFIIMIVMSLFSLLLTYDAVSGEKEQGMLRLMFTNQVYRRQLLIAKYLGALLVMIPLLLCIFAIALLMMTASQSIRLLSPDLIRIGIIFSLTCIYISLFLLLGLFISSRTSSSASSLMSSVFIWIIAAMVISNAGLHIAREVSPIPAKKGIDDALTNLDQDLDKHYRQIQAKRPDDAISLINLHYEEHQDNGLWLAGNTRESYDYWTCEIGVYDRLLEEYAERKNDIQKMYLDALLKQNDIASRYASLSPAFLLKDAIESLAGVGTDAFLHFLDNARAYRLSFLQFLQQKHHDYPYRYITPDDDRQIKPAGEWLSYWTNGKYKSYDKLFKGRTNEESREAFFQAFDTTGKMAFLDRRNFQPLNLSDMPSFQYHALSTAERVERSMSPIMLLTILNILLFALCHNSFTKYDMR